MSNKLLKLLKKAFKGWEHLFKKQLKISVGFLVELVRRFMGNRRNKETPLISILVTMNRKKVLMTSTKKNLISLKRSS